MHIYISILMYGCISLYILAYKYTHIHIHIYTYIYAINMCLYSWKNKMITIVKMLVDGTFITDVSL